MFDFTKETIINSLKLEDGTSRVMSETGKMFRVLRCADYLKANLAPAKVYKSIGRVGKMATALFDVPTVNGTYRVDINLKLSDKYLSDYATAVYKFQKVVMSEFKLTGTDNANKMANAIKLAIPENYKFLKVEVTGGKVLVTCTDPYQFFETAQVLTYVPNATLPSEGDYEFYSNAVVNKNVTPFATGEWLMENLRYPTYPNLRYNALNQEEYPIKGSLYTQYAFQYSVSRQGLSGLGTVGQTLQSLTTHVFYVLNSLVNEFEAHLTNAFGNIIEVIGNETVYAITVLPNDVDNDGIAHSLNATISPVSGFTPNFIYSLQTPITGVTLTSDGEITVSPTVNIGDIIPVVVKETNTLTEVVKDITVQ